MHLIESLREIRWWMSLSADDPSIPIEHVPRSTYPCLVAAGFSSMFNREVLSACCEWSKAQGDERIGAFFTKPDPSDFFSDAGFYGGFSFSGQDDPVLVEKSLFQDRNGSGLLSVYEASHRAFILPETAAWMLVGDRDADLALYCFRSERDQVAFLRTGDQIETFETLADAARYAKSFMNYSLDC